MENGQSTPTLLQMTAASRGSVAQWLGRRSWASGLSLIYA